MDKMFEVEKIVKSKMQKGVVLYNVKWIDYDKSENTWEPKEHLPQEMVLEFNEKKRSKSKKVCKIFLF